MGRRCARPHSVVGESLYFVELSGSGLDGGRSRPKARPHLGLARAQGSRERLPYHARCAQLGAAIRPRSRDGDARRLNFLVYVVRWPGDMAQVLSLAPAIKMSLAIWLVRLANSSRRRRAAAGSLSSTR